MIVFVMLLFSIAALLVVLDILMCCGKLQALKVSVFGERKSVGAGLFFIGIIYTVCGFTVLSLSPYTVVVLLGCFFLTRVIFSFLKRNDQ